MNAGTVLWLTVTAGLIFGLGCADHSSEPVPRCSAALVPLEQLDQAPSLIGPPQVVYPENARRLEQEGAVRLAIVIGEDGTVCEARVDSTSGFLELDQAAQTAALTATFTPPRRHGTPVRTSATISIRYSLH